MNALAPLPFAAWRGNQSHETIAECVDNCENWRCGAEHQQCNLFDYADVNNELRQCAVHDLYEEQIALDTEALRRWGSE